MFGWKNRGTHWRDLKDLRFRALAEERAQYSDPLMDDAEEDHDGTIEVIFGSIGSCLTLRKVDDNAIGVFGYGYCTLLALAVHRKTGLPLVLFTFPTDSDDWCGHAAIQVGKDAYLDINGVNTEEDIHRRYPKVGAPIQVTEVEFCNIVASGEHVADPMSFVEELEQLVTHDFALHLIDKNQITNKLN